MKKPERLRLHRFEIQQGHALVILRTLPSESVHCCITSPPYWGLRDYGVAPIAWGGDPTHRHEWGPQILVNATNHVDKRRWSHAYNGRGEEQPAAKPRVESSVRFTGQMVQNLEPYPKHETHAGSWVTKHPTLKPKDLIGVPWRVALALQADGWYLRSDIIWAKTNPMPESVGDRPTKSHEYLFLLSKSRRYFYDASAIREPFRHPERTYKSDTQEHKTAKLREQGNRCTSGLHDGRTRYGSPELGRNKRSVWMIATEPYSGAHFATYPKALVAPCVKAGTSERGCCPSCGAPWRRVLDRTSVRPSDYRGKWSVAPAQASGGGCWPMFERVAKPEKITTAHSRRP
jgi:DNA modification methylase